MVNKYVSEYKIFRAYGNGIIKSLFKTLALANIGRVHIYPKYWL